MNRKQTKEKSRKEKSTFKTKSEKPSLELRDLAKEDCLFYNPVKVNWVITKTDNPKVKKYDCKQSDCSIKCKIQTDGKPPTKCLRPGGPTGVIVHGPLIL